MAITYIGDSPVIKLYTSITLTGGSLLIKFERPDGSTGHWDATVDPTDPTSMQYMASGVELNYAGIWRVQSYMELDGWKGHGTFAEMTVLNPTY
jgi:hypothetical protein